MASTHSPHVIRGIVFAGIGATLWGFSGACGQLLLSTWSIPTEWVVSVRLALSSLLFLIISSVRTPGRVPTLLRDRKSLLTVIAFSFFAVIMLQYAYYTTIHLTNAGTATVLERTAMVVVLVFTCIVARRLPRWREVVAIILAFSGIFIMATQGNPGSLALPLMGLAWGVITAITDACYTLIPAKLMKSYDAFTVSGVAMALAAVVYSIYAHPWTLNVQVTPQVAGVMALIVIGGTVLSYAFYMQGVKDAGPVYAGLMGSMEIVSAVFFSAAWLGTAISVFDIIGCALVIGMVILITLSDNAKARTSNEQA